MGKAARLKQERRVTKPPPVGKSATRPPQQMVLLATAGVVGIIVVVVVVLLATKSSPKTAPPAKVTASDANAPASLISAAQAVGFHPTTEAGVGEIESKPASAAGAPDDASQLLLPVGTYAPNFTLQTPQGQKVSLASYRGHAVLLEFFASWCPHCNAEEPHLAPMARSLASKGIRFLAVNADGETAPSVYAFHRYYGMSYPALVDPSANPGSFNSPGSAGQVSTVYKIEEFPTFYILDKTGKITWRSNGEQPDALLKQEVLKAEAGA
jgi:thiol-disulfide isomerase/thioredoxin